MPIQFVPRDGEQVAEEATLPAKLIARAHTGQERPLNQLVDIAVELVLEEPSDRAEMALKQLVAGLVVSLSPAFE